MPSGVVEDEDDGSITSSAGLSGKGGEQRVEERLGDAVMHVPKHFAGRGRDEGGHVQPVEPMVAQRNGPNADRRPHAAHDRLQAEAMLVGREDFDRPAWMLRRLFGYRVGEFFLNAAASSGVADLGFFGRGVWIDQSSAFNASHPRCVATFVRSSSCANHAATFELVQTPPSAGGSLNRTRSFSSSSGFKIVAVAPFRRRKSPSASGPSAL